MTPAFKSFLIGYALGIVVGVILCATAQWLRHRQRMLWERERAAVELGRRADAVLTSDILEARIKRGSGVVEEDDPAWYSPEPSSNVVAVEPKQIPVMRHRAQEEQKRGRM